MDLDYQEIGRNIRRFRQAKGLKQKELAELIQVSDQHVSHIENAHTQVSLPTLVAIANALQTDCNTLLGATLTEARQSILHQQLLELSRAYRFSRGKRNRKRNRPRRATGAGRKRRRRRKRKLKRSPAT